MRGEDLWQVSRIALRNSSRYRLQTTLVLVATMTGTAGVIVSSGYAAGGREKIIDQFSRLGTNIIIVTPQQSKSVGGRARTGTIVSTLKDSDYAALRQSVPSVALSSAIVTTTLRLRAGDLTKNVTVLGCEPAYFDIQHWQAVRGRVFDEVDSKRQNRVVMLGANVSQELFGNTDPTGSRLTINRIPFVVAGVLSERGQGLDAANEDDQVVVPLQTAMHRLTNSDFFSSIRFEIDDWSHMDTATEEMNGLLGKRHRTDQTQPDFQVQSQKSLIDTALASFSRLTFLMRWISASAMFVSSLGILALTWMGVRNRTREIGTRRAIGGTRAHILAQFSIESTIASLFGCGSGLVVGYISLGLICSQAQQPLVFSSQVALLEVGSSAVLYVFLGVFASLKATTVQPVVALRSE